MRAKRRDRRIPWRGRPFRRARARLSRARNASSRCVSAARLEARLLEPNARASREPAASPPAETASVPLRAASPDESRREANADQLAILGQLLRPKLSRDSRTDK